MEQNISTALGKSGCYFFSILRLASNITGKQFNAIEEYKTFTNNGWMGEDCFIADPEKIMEKLTNKKWKVSIRQSSYVCKEKEYEILKYVYKIGHFVLGDRKGNVLYDPYMNSETVAKGRIESKRVFQMQ